MPAERRPRPRPRSARRRARTPAGASTEVWTQARDSGPACPGHEAPRALRAGGVHGARSRLGGARTSVPCSSIPQGRLLHRRCLQSTVTPLGAKSCQNLNLMPLPFGQFPPLGENPGLEPGNIGQPAEARDGNHPNVLIGRRRTRRWLPATRDGGQASRVPPGGTGGRLERMSLSREEAKSLAYWRRHTSEDREKPGSEPDIDRTADPRLHLAQQRRWMRTQIPTERTVGVRIARAPAAMLMLIAGCGRRHSFRWATTSRSRLTSQRTRRPGPEARAASVGAVTVAVRTVAGAHLASTTCSVSRSSAGSNARDRPKPYSSAKYPAASVVGCPPTSIVRSRSMDESSTR